MERANKAEEISHKEQPDRSTGKYAQKKGCYNCGDLSHIQRNCPKLRPESSSQFGKPDVSARSGRVSTLLATATPENVEELSVQQLEKLLVTKRLSIEKN